MWDVSIGRVQGVANWVVAYSSLLDALTGGTTGVACEMSFRLKREDIERAHGTDAVNPPLDAMASVCQALHDLGELFKYFIGIFYWDIFNCLGTHDAAGWDTGVHLAPTVRQGDGGDERPAGKVE